MNWNVGQNGGGLPAPAGMMPGAVPGMMPGAVPPPPAANPQVFAQNYSCPTPNIQTFQQPPCNDPATSVQVTRRVFDTFTSGVFVSDTGRGITAGFGGGTLAGANATPPTPGRFAVITDSTTTGVVRDITIAWDAFADQADGPASDEALRSYAGSFSAVLGGKVTVNNTPFPTVIPIASAIKNVGGVRSYWSQQSATNQYYVSATMEATHAHAPAPIEIFLPEASDFSVEIDVPTRALASATYTTLAGTAFQYVWTGVITILQENNTKLGSIATR